MDGKYRGAVVRNAGYIISMALYITGRELFYSKSDGEASFIGKVFQNMGYVLAIVHFFGRG